MRMTVGAAAVSDASSPRALATLLTSMTSQMNLHKCGWTRTRTLEEPCLAEVGRDTRKRRVSKGVGRASATAPGRKSVRKSNLIYLLTYMRVFHWDIRRRLAQTAFLTIETLLPPIIITHGEGSYVKLFFN